MTAVQESSTVEVEAVVKSMGLAKGLATVSTITKWHDVHTITLPCLRKVDKSRK